MICKKCKAEIPDNSFYCNLCGAPQKKDPKRKAYQRPDGLFEKSVVVNKKRVYFRGKTESEVNRKMVAFNAERENGKFFEDIADDWWESHSEELSYNSLKNYKPAYIRAREAFEGQRIGTITPQDVKNFIRAFEAKGYAKKTTKTQLSILIMIFTHAIGQNMIKYNPAEYVKISAAGKTSRHREPPTEEEVEIINSSVDKPFGAFAFFLEYTGCRRGEALALQYRDIDRKAKTISITKSVYFENNAPRIKEPKTAAGIRKIPLLDIVSEVVGTGKPNEYIFGNPNNKKELLRQHEFDKLWKMYLAETGLELTPHQLRHGYATLLFENDIPEKDAQEFLGHSTLQMTQEIYTHIRKNHRAKIFATMESIGRGVQK